MLVGKDIYEKLIKGYTEKQWGREVKDLLSFIIKWLPIRYTYNNNYFNDRYQGIPIIFGSRLGDYRCYDMDKVIEVTLDSINREIDR